MNRFRPQCEVLESRELLATVYLDFNWEGGSFSDLFRGSRRYLNKYRNSLDFDRNRRVDSRDVNLAVNQICWRTQKLLQDEYNVSPVDIWSNEGTGERIEEAATDYVIYVGGRGPEEGVLGQAYLAWSGVNLTTGWNYATETLIGLAEWNAPLGSRNGKGPHSSIFAHAIATVAAHEWGHAIGLGHQGVNEHDIMLPYIIFGTLQTFQGWAQAEIQRSRAEPFHNWRDDLRGELHELAF